MLGHGRREDRTPTAEHQPFVFDDLICQQYLDPLLMTSENDLIYIQAAKQLGTLSQKRPALRDLSNRADVNNMGQTPLAKRFRKKAMKASDRDPPMPMIANTPARSPELGWLAMHFPPDIGAIRQLQVQQGHLFQIHRKHLCHLGTIPQLRARREPPGRAVEVRTTLSSCFGPSKIKISKRFVFKNTL